MTIAKTAIATMKVAQTCAVKRRAVTRGMPTKLVALLKRSKAWHC